MGKTVSVHDVAAYILKQRGGSMSTMKLQKLCYYSQGWSLAWDEAPLFSEDIQAWANGPVIYELFKQHRGKFNVSSKWPKGDPDKLSKDQRETIDAVLHAYGGLSGQQLSDKTHGERPWVEARRGCSAGAASSTVISLESMQDYFGALAHEEADDAEYDEDGPDEAFFPEDIDSGYDYEPDDYEPDYVPDIDELEWHASAG